MPARIPKACRVRACAGNSTAKHGYCDEHQSKAKDRTWQGAEKGRGGRKWRRLREKIRARAKGLCEAHKLQGIYLSGCICDHIINKAEGGDDSEPNLQWLCKPCHDEKTAKESARGKLMYSC
ncbi:MAG: HNH endonuclease [Oceanospirillaceae bacterium]|nr:HNH endonuclease [Oceanospirillaceae bacterium]